MAQLKLPAFQEARFARLLRPYDEQANFRCVERRGDDRSDEMEHFLKLCGMITPTSSQQQKETTMKSSKYILSQSKKKKKARRAKGERPHSTNTSCIICSGHKKESRKENFQTCLTRLKRTTRRFLAIGSLKRKK
jgi:hypothetical protein